jgi:inhibitor of cysteine peptidase
MAPASALAAEPIELEPGAHAEATIKRGQPFDVLLKANFSTGFRWEVGRIEVPAVILRSAGKRTRRASPSQGAGAPTVQAFEFEGISAGKTDIVFVYRRPWEKNVPPAATASLAITVNE